MPSLLACPSPVFFLMTVSRTADPKSRAAGSSICQPLPKDSLLRLRITSLTNQSFLPDFRGRPKSVRKLSSRRSVLATFIDSSLLSWTAESRRSSHGPFIRTLGHQGRLCSGEKRSHQGSSLLRDCHGQREWGGFFFLVFSSLLCACIPFFFFSADKASTTKWDAMLQTGSTADHKGNRKVLR